ncbi:MAG: Hsp20/alpha crystallin family protein [Desulfurococcales archaeon]|nr:Hsp20/alpha crystallin family protein [Desulfurococcales archaeon]
MSWFRRRRSIFDIFDEILREMEEEMRSIEEEFSRLLREGKGKVRGPYYYGVRITIGPDGVPRVEEFGNIKRGVAGKPEIREEIEPLVDVIEHEDEVWVVAELPGVDKDKIKVKAREDKVIIKAENEKRYYKEVELPAKVKPETAKASYKNGVLEVKLKKKEPERREEEGLDVKVE